MCGIVGIVYRDGQREASAEKLSRSASLISHRGPDGSGTASLPGAGLAHARLSLLDLNTRSNQPFWDESRRYCLVYNGELYNFQILRDSLRQRGVQFRTTSDTEVLLQSLIVDGAHHTLPRLEGMFAFAFYDTLEKKLLLARDRFGIKPLLVYEDEAKLVFASEVKAMTPWVTLRPNGFQMIRHLMNYGAPVRNCGFFEGVEILPAGSMMIVQPGKKAVTESFMKLPQMLDRDLAEELNGLSKEQAVDRVDELMQRSVERMLFADAPVGALCSGGVDSSLLMAMAARKHSNLAIFHANVVGPLSEYDAAATLARHLKLDLKSVETRDEDFIELTPEVLYHYEQPFYGHPHSVPFMMVSKLVRDNGVKAVLTGEGSDECFLGYEYLAMEPLWARLDSVMDGIKALVRQVPVIGPRLLPSPPTAMLTVADMLGQFEVELDTRAAREIFRQRMGREPDLNVRTLEMLGNHLRTLLHRNDMMGMRASIEARFPFLDEQLVATAINLPLKYKISFSAGVWEKDHPFLRDKWVIRKVADRYLPKELSQRPKLGFAVSAYQRLKVGRGFFDTGFVKDYFKLSRAEMDVLFEAGDRRLENKLMMLETWGQLFMRGTPVAMMQQSLARHASF